MFGVVAKISREGTEKQTRRSRRAWEFSRSRAQENGRSERANAKKENRRRTVMQQDFVGRCRSPHGKTLRRDTSVK